MEIPLHTRGENKSGLQTREGWCKYYLRVFKYANECFGHSRFFGKGSSLCLHYDRKCGEPWRNISIEKKKKLSVLDPCPTYALELALGRGAKVTETDKREKTRESRTCKAVFTTKNGCSPHVKAYQKQHISQYIPCYFYLVRW